MAECLVFDVVMNDTRSLLQKYYLTESYLQHAIINIEIEPNTLAKEVTTAFSKAESYNFLKQLGSFFSAVTSFLTGDLGGAVENGLEVAKGKAEVTYTNGANYRFKHANQLLSDTKEMFGVYTTQVVKARIAEAWVAKDAVAAKVYEPEDDVAVFIRLAAKKYKAFQNMVTPGQVGDIVANLVQVMTTYCDAIGEFRTSGNSAAAQTVVNAIARCYGLVNSIGGLEDRLHDGNKIQDQIRESILRADSSNIQCNAAQDVAEWAKGDDETRRGRRMLRTLQAVDGPASEPYFAMAYSILAKLLLDHRLQEAAHQFCKFYKYKNGGVAPPMCDSLDEHPHYTLNQILSMRSYRAPAPRRVEMRVLLPTQAIPNKATGGFYPFVDLKKLGAGAPVTFDAPVADLAWLKKYRWISSDVNENAVPSMFVESTRLYLPLDANEEAVALGSNFAASVFLESTTKQVSSWKKRSRTFELPTQTFTLESSHNDQFCADMSTTTDPYHKAAVCVQPDGTPSVCVRERGTSGTQSSEGILPNLFAPWCIRAEFDRESGMYRVVEPSVLNVNATVGQELNLIADVTILQMTAAVTPADAKESDDAGHARPADAESTCCAPNYFRVTVTTCQSCAADPALVTLVTLEPQLGRVRA